MAKAGPLSTAIYSLYRVSRFIAFLRIPLVPTVIDYLVRFVFSCFVPHTAKIGSGLILGYGGLGTVIHAMATLGDNVYIGQGVTIGVNIKERDVARIGNNVYIGSGAKILGPITIGDETIIGANAVVVSDIPSRCVACGIPAKIIKDNINTDDYLGHFQHHRQRRQ